MGIVLGVALGGAVGAVLRYWIAGVIQPPWWEGFPFGIFIVNVSGGLVMGIITALLALKMHVSPEMRAFLTTGVLGGYTTFSTFSLDSAILIERGAYAQAGVYVVASAVLSILAIFAGLWIVRAF